MHEYDLEIGSIIQKIRDEGAERVLIQLPDGLKQYADEMQREIRKVLNVEIIFWGGTAFGSCDLPLQVERLGVDLVIHLGHAPWR